jgi:hypothetical protein
MTEITEAPKPRKLTTNERRAWRWGYQECQRRLIEQLENSRNATAIAGYVVDEPAVWFTSPEGGDT